MEWHLSAWALSEVNCRVNTNQKWPGFVIGLLKQKSLFVIKFFRKPIFIVYCLSQFHCYNQLLTKTVGHYRLLYNNTCSLCIFIGRELCVIKVHTHGWRQLMAWSNLANLFRGSSHDFCQLYYNIKQIDFIFLCFCTVIDHRWRHSVWRTKSHARDAVECVLFCSSRAMTSSVIYYSTDARKNEI